MNQSELIWILTWLLVIFSFIGLSGALFEATMRLYSNYKKIDKSDLVGRLQSGEELSNENMF